MTARLVGPVHWRVRHKVAVCAPGGRMVYHHYEGRALCDPYREAGPDLELSNDRDRVMGPDGCGNCQRILKSRNRTS